MKKAGITFENLHITFLVENTQLSKDINVNSVFLIGFINEKIVTVLNERGWDIPGGHVEPTDLDFFSALQREVIEESGVSIEKAIPYALLQFKDRKETMLFYASNSCTRGKFIPSFDAIDSKIMSVDAFLSAYHGKKEVMKILINNALEYLKF